MLSVMEAALEGPVERGHPGLLRRLQEGLSLTCLLRVYDKNEIKFTFI